MSKNRFSWELFRRAPIVGIIRGVTIQDVKKILPIYREAGLTTVEVTMNTTGATDIIEYAREFESEGLNIGAGTVCNKEDLKSALDAGAQFIVTPILNKKVVRKCVEKDVPVFPGAYTPTEIYNAWELGATMVKVYPATSLGPGYIKDLKAPMKQLRLLPTGGVGLENMIEFLDAGANGLGIGGQLFDKNLIKEQDWEGLKAHFQQFVQKLSD